MDKERSLRVQVKFKNANLLRAIEEQFGYLRQANYHSAPGVIRPAAAVMGVSYSKLQEYIRLATNPYSEKDGQLKESAAKIATALSLEPSEAFPPELYAGLFVTRTKDISPTQILSLGAKEARMIEDVDQNPLRLLEAAEQRQAIQELLQQVSPRKERVLSMFFGLDGQDEHNLTEIAAKEGLTTEGIRQIKEKALRRLKKVIEQQPLKEAARKRLRGETA